MFIIYYNSFYNNNYELFNLINSIFQSESSIPIYYLLYKQLI